MTDLHGANSGGWIGVDLDGTLAFYDGWKGPTHIGAPIPAMVRRVNDWVNAGKTVKLVTARVAPGKGDAEICRQAIVEWMAQHLTSVLEITHAKDHKMVELWDDRVVQVIPNTGERADLAERRVVTRPAGVKQTRYSKGEGNCFNACLATLLGVPLEKIDCRWDEENWLCQLDALLRPFGYCFMEWEFDAPWVWCGKCYMIATGDSPRGGKHAVIVRHFIDTDGRHCVVNHFDPYPGDRFLDKIDSVGVLFPHWESRF